MMRMVIGIGLALLVGCGGGVSEREACEHVVSCLVEGADPAPPQSEIDEAVDECVSDAAAENVSQECLDCVDSASCSEILGESDRCDSVCDEGNSDDVSTDDDAPDGTDSDGARF